MFRTRKNQGEDDPNGAQGEARGFVGDSSLMKRPPRRQFRIPAEPPGGGFHPDVPRRPTDGLESPAQSEEQSPGIADGKCLVVGREIRLKGEITSCEQVVVEGQIEVSLTDARRVQVGPTGLFRGKADVAEADIAGRFEGELTVRDRLTVRATGRISGKIRYGRIIVEAGGELAGEIAALSPDNSRGGTVRSLPRAAVDTTAGDLGAPLQDRDREPHLEASRD